MKNPIIEVITKAYQQIFNDDELAAEAAVYTDVVSFEQFLKELLESVINNDMKLCMSNTDIEKVDGYTVMILHGKSKDFAIVYDDKEKKVAGTAIIRWGEYR